MPDESPEDYETLSKLLRTIEWTRTLMEEASHELENEAEQVAPF